LLSDIVKIVAKSISNNNAKTNVVSIDPNNNDFLLCNI
jgi:hypothetical protein